MKILICGIGGRMGREVLKLAEEGYRGAVPAAGYDVNETDITAVPVYRDLAAVKEKPDVIIDFSHHAGTEALLKYAARQRRRALRKKRSGADGGDEGSPS